VQKREPFGWESRKHIIKIIPLETALTIPALDAIPDLEPRENVLLSGLTRFGIGGPARWLADASTEAALIAALEAIRQAGCPAALIGGGTNLIASDAGFTGVVLRYRASGITLDGTRVEVAAGAVLQDLVDASITHGLCGLETMTGIPGWVGGAIYGNAGAYGHSIQERVERVRFFDGQAVREIGNTECEFEYRESVFKRHKHWVVLSASLRLEPAEPAELASIAAGILKIRNEKYPPSMRCAGSIFKNLMFREIPEPLRSQVPPAVIREGKVAAAYFVEQTGAKGMTDGDLRVADYHANLIYNTGSASATRLRALIATLKSRVREQFGLELEEEVQFLA
jgi:UDP-N-acetylmuramate dehydrogenase